MALFYKLSIDTIDTILTVGLPKSAQNLLWYLCKLNPFGDHRIQITWQKAQQAIGISKASFYRALAQLKDAGLLISQSFSGFCVSLKNKTTVSDLKPESQNCDTESQNWDATLYIDLQTDQTLSEGESAKKEKISDPDAGQQDKVPIAVCGIATVEQHSSVTPISQGEEKFSAAACTKKHTKGFNWLPEGPWNIEGKLDPNFRDFIVNDWLKRFGGDIHAKRADVLSHFKKDPANLPIRWEQYQSEYLNRVQNTQILLSNGVAIKPETQDKLLTHHRALTAELPAEMNVVATPIANLTEAVTSMPEARFAPAAEITAVTALPAPEASQEPKATAPAHAEGQEPEAETPSKSSVTSPKPLVKSSSLPETPSKNPEAVETEDGQRLKVFQRQEQEDDRDPGKLREMVQGFLKGFGKSRTETVKPQPVIENLEHAIIREEKAKKQAYLDELNAWIADPLLRDEAVKKVAKSDCYQQQFQIQTV